MALYVNHLKLFQQCHSLKYLNCHIKSRPIKWWVKSNKNIKTQLSVLSIPNVNSQLSLLTIPYFSCHSSNNNGSYENNQVQYCSKYKKKSSIAQQKYKAVLHDKQEKIIASGLKIKKQGKMILSDIKETKVKMKEKMEAVIEVSMLKK